MITEQASKAFFFAKKKQKTFAPSLAYRARLLLRGRAAARAARAVMPAGGQEFFGPFLQKRTAFFLIVATAILPRTSAAAEDVSALLRAKTQLFSDAGQQGNAGVLKALLDDNVVFFNENGDSSTKAEIVSDATSSPASSSVRMTVTDWHCAVHGDVAVASFIDDQVKDLHGQVFHAQYRSVETWLKADGDWRMIASQTLALSTDPAAVKLPPALLDQYVGTYQATPELVAVFARDGADLTLSANGSQPSVQRAELRDVVFTPGSPRVRRIFTRDARGNVSGFISRREGHDIVFKRVEQG